MGKSTLAFGYTLCFLLSFVPSEMWLRCVFALFSAACYTAMLAIEKPKN